MDPPRLTVTTIRYLYATTWLPCEEREKTVAVPGGQTTALDTAGNLLHTALWNLRRQGVFDFEQLRPVEVEQVVVLGGRSFSSFEFRDPGQDLRGLEGALIKAGRDVASGGGFADRQIDRVTGEDGHGVRRLVTAMPLHNMAPWATVVGYCFAEAKAAGLVDHKGWAIKRVAITDQPAIESLRERNDELRAARRADMEREPDLHNAVAADCLHAVKGAYSTLD